MGNYPGHPHWYPGYIPPAETHVVIWQTRMWQYGYVFLQADGKFGAATDYVTRQFQSNKGLFPDGIVGPLTWAAA